MASRTHNPEKRAWRGRSYRTGGKNVRALREAEPAASSVLDYLNTPTPDAPACNYDGMVRIHLPPTVLDTVTGEVTGGPSASEFLRALKEKGKAT